MNNPLKYIDPTGHNGDSVEYYVDPSEYEGNDALWGFDMQLALPGIGTFSVTLWIPNVDVNGILAGNKAFWDGVTYYEKPEGVGLCIDTTIAKANWNADNPNPTGEPIFLAWFSDQFERLWDDSVESLKLQYRAAGGLTKDAYNWTAENTWRIIGTITVAYGVTNMWLGYGVMGFGAVTSNPLIMGLGVIQVLTGLGFVNAGKVMIENNAPLEPEDYSPMGP